MTFRATFSRDRGNRLVRGFFFRQPGDSVVIDDDAMRPYFEANPDFTVSEDKPAEDAPEEQPEIPGSQPEGVMTTDDLPSAEAKPKRSRSK
jgi:hypothetical protein